MKRKAVVAGGSSRRTREEQAAYDEMRASPGILFDPDSPTTWSSRTRAVPLGGLPPIRQLLHRQPPQHRLLRRHQRIDVAALGFVGDGFEFTVERQQPARQPRLGRGRESPPSRAAE